MEILINRPSCMNPKAPVMILEFDCNPQSVMVVVFGAADVDDALDAIIDQHISGFSLPGIVTGRFDDGCFTFESYSEHKTTWDEYISI